MTSKDAGTRSAHATGHQPASCYPRSYSRAFSTATGACAASVSTTCSSSSPTSWAASCSSAGRLRSQRPTKRSARPKNALMSRCARGHQPRKGNGSRFDVGRPVGLRHLQHRTEQTVRPGESPHAGDLLLAHPRAQGTARTPSPSEDPERGAAGPLRATACTSLESNGSTTCSAATPRIPSLNARKSASPDGAGALALRGWLSRASGRACRRRIARSRAGRSSWSDRRPTSGTRRSRGTGSSARARPRSSPAS
jgi:hypothetical protein